MEISVKNDSLENQIAFLSSILDSMPFVVFVKDTDFKYVYTNKMADVVNGVERGALYGKTDEAIAPDNKLSKLYSQDNQTLIETKKGKKSIIPVFDNEIWYTTLIQEPLFDKDNNVNGILGIISQEAVRNTRKTLFKNPNYKENDDNLLFDYDFEKKQYVILKTVDGFKSLDRLSFVPDYDIIDEKIIYPNDIPIFETHYKKLINGEGPVQLIVRIFNDENIPVYCNVEAACIYNENDVPIRMIASLQPISEDVVRNERINIDVKAANQQLLSLIRNTYDICLYVSPDYNYYSILYATDLFADFDQTGDWNSFIDIMYERLHPSDYGTLKTIFLTLSLYGDDQLNMRKLKEFRYADKSGLYQWKSFTVNPVQVQDSKGFILAFYDVTEAVAEREQRNLKNMNNELIDVLSTVVEFRDMESGEHIARIKQFTRILLCQVNKIYDEYNFTNEEIEIISTASAMHDIGKIAVPDNILLKPGRLTQEEFELMKTHAMKGCQILSTMPRIQDESYYKYSYEICRHHHERYDGRGYPDGLKGEEIPIEAQIVAVADVFDALTSERCYKPSYDYEKAIQMIKDGECGAFSERMLKCLELAKKDMIDYSKITKGELL